MSNRKTQKRWSANDIRLGDKVFVKSQRLSKAKEGDAFEVIEIVTVSIKSMANGRIRNVHTSHLSLRLD